MIIPIGSDCSIADFCKKYKLRTCSLPFDWVVTYDGVSKCIENDFIDFTKNLEGNNIKYNKYDIYFYHDFINDINDINRKDDEIKYTRRIERFQNILENSKEELIFFRKGHWSGHHHEQNAKYSNIISDIDDAENLDIILSKKYPNLKYKIIVVLVCEKCYDSNKIYKSSISDKIELYSVLDSKFQECARNIFKV